MRYTKEILIAAVLALPACTPKNLFIAHDTVLGINASLDQGRQQGQLVIGYDRDFAAVVPKTVPSEKQPGRTDAMAMVNCTHLEVKGIYLNRYSDIVVTGDAARKMVDTGQLNAAKIDCESP